MTDRHNQRHAEPGYVITPTGQVVEQAHRNDEQLLVPGSTEREGEFQTNTSSKPKPPSGPPALPRNYNTGGQVPHTEKPQLISNRSFANDDQDSRGVRPPMTAREPSNVQRQPPGSYHTDQQYAAPPHEKSHSNKSSKMSGFKSFMRGESNPSQRHEDDYSRKDNFSRQDDYSRKDNRSGKDDYSRMQRYRAERDEAEQSLEELHQQTSKRILELERALQTEQETVKVIKLSAHELQKTKDTKQLVFGVQETDDVIRRRFESLLADIRTWASGFACTMGQELHLEAQMRSEYQQVAPCCETLDHLHAAVKSEKAKQDKKQKRHFIRGWTSCMMVKSLFRILDEQGNLGEDAGLPEEVLKAFERLENILWHKDDNVIPKRSFNDWRALTVHLLSEATEHPSRGERLHARSESAALEVMSLVHVWADADKVQDLTASLINIFQDALAFSQFLRQQRALWTPRLPTMLSRVGPLMFDAGCMKDDNLSDDEDDDRTGGAQNRLKSVLLVISPALYKRGTMDGAKFDLERAVVPARVTVATA